MSQPFTFVGTHRIKKGKLEEYRKELQELVEFVEANEPRLIAFNLYVDEKANRVSGVQVHPDAESMQLHMRLVSQHIRGSFDFFAATEGIEVYGETPAALLESIRQFSAPDTPLRFLPRHEAGFTRSSAAR
jgi:quinol monooxygenase YgiN